ADGPAQEGGLVSRRAFEGEPQAADERMSLAHARFAVVPST
ncbi:MAG: hypothetical protein QOE67_1582, partial [Solirubrobacteraceae bacterium]|nr:hypothetical protein [Solirubrobacteraceae bacterium]